MHMDLGKCGGGVSRRFSRSFGVQAISHNRLLKSVFCGYG
jgi:hypothetical protein